MSNYKFPYQWYLKDSYPAKGIEQHNFKVFGTFICGGGSTMGYKLAGFEHLGGVEIDPKIADVYNVNHKPKFLYNEDIRLFNKRTELPKELFELDILDGSPPCSSFSMAGNREKDWGKEKVFKEGQAKQTLDDLFFDYIELANRLQPKVVIAENVKGLIQGNARAYVKRIFAAFDKAGYNVQLFLLNAASMGVPQKRERVFFVAQRKDLSLPKLKLEFDEKSIIFQEIQEIQEIQEKNTKFYSDWTKRIPTDKNFGDINQRTEGKHKSFGRVLLHNKEVSPTIISGNDYIHYAEYKLVSKNELCKIGSYPIDYNFKNIEPKYLIGMSVPPVMTAQISYQIYLQWLSKLK